MDSRSTSKGYHIYREIRIKNRLNLIGLVLRISITLQINNTTKEPENISFSGSFFNTLIK